MIMLRRVCLAPVRISIVAVAVAVLACGREGTPLHPEASTLSIEPAAHDLPDLARFNDHGWDRLKGKGWSYLRRTASKNADIATDDTAPISASKVLRIIFTRDMGRDSEPGVHWIALPAVREVYAGWSVKWSPNWACSPAGCGKIAFFHTRGEGVVYMNYGDFGRTSNPKTISVNTHWAPYGERVWPANRALTTITPGTWYRIAWYHKYASSISEADGVIRWWVNGALNGEYTDVRFPSGGFTQFEFAPTLQNPPPAEQYMYIDHTHVSIR
jgi:hypothetical protein